MKKLWMMITISKSKKTIKGTMKPTWGSVLATIMLPIR